MKRVLMGVLSFPLGMRKTDDDEDKVLGGEGLKKETWMQNYL